MTPADQQMDRVAAAQARSRMTLDEVLAWSATVDVVQRHLSNAYDDLRVLQAQFGDLSGRMTQIAAPLRVAADRSDLDAAQLHALIKDAAAALSDAASQPVRALAQLDAVRRAER